MTKTLTLLNKSIGGQLNWSQVLRTFNTKIDSKRLISLVWFTAESAVISLKLSNTCMVYMEWMQNCCQKTLEIEQEDTSTNWLKETVDLISENNFSLWELWIYGMVYWLQLLKLRHSTHSNQDLMTILEKKSTVFRSQTLAWRCVFDLQVCESLPQ